MAITPIPAVRVSDLLTRRRLLTQLRNDETALLRLQTTISTGRRLALPSDDAPAALRGIETQRLLERKAQAKINLQVSQSYLSASDNALAAVSNLLAEARGAAVGAASVSSGPEQRETAAATIDGIIGQILGAANQQFRDRRLFGGSLTGALPFEYRDGRIVYTGNETELQSFSDLEQLFATNLPGSHVFGALSPPISGVDLNPILSRDTRLADLRGGFGIADGSIRISDGASTRVIDLSGAETVGDVADLLAADPPVGRTVFADITATGLNVSLDAAGAGNLTIHEVAGGGAAEQLGILETTGAGTGPVVGGDLNPLLTLTTPLDNVLGVRATARVASTGGRNDLLIQAKNRGSEFNGWSINYIDDGTVAAGHETVAIDTGAKTVTVNIDSGFTRANQVVAALNAHAAFSADFTAEIDPREPGNDGLGLVALAASGATSGGAGVELDRSGIQLVSGQAVHTVDLSAVETVEDLLNAFNSSPAGVLAEIDATGRGITLRSRVSGADFSIGENGGLSATQLGLRTFTEATRLDGLNHGLGVHQVNGADFSIRRKDGVELQFDLAGAATIGDVLNLINTHPSNLDPLTRVAAQLSDFGNGIELVTTSTAVTASFAVLRQNFSQAAQDLGLLPAGAAQSAPATIAGGTETITGRDANPREVGGVFDSLLKTRAALQSGDLVELGRVLEVADTAATSMNYARGELGIRQQTLDTLQARLDVEEVELTSVLSEEIDTDLADAISQMVARQAAFQASLQLAGQLSRITLLDFV